MSQTEPTITIACPVRNRQFIISHYLEHLYQLNYPRKLINLLFVINNSNDNSEKILKKFKNNHDHEYNQINIDHYNKNKNVPEDKRTNEIRLKHTYSHLADLRNYITSTTKTDYLLSCDSDILVPSDTLRKLLSANVDACAGLIWNGHKFAKDEPWKYPNLLRKSSNGKFEHISNYYIKNAPNLTESKIAEVGASGAVILLSRNIYTQTRYQWDEQGEDCGWARDCENKGFKIHVNYAAYCHHLMDEQMLQEYLDSHH